MNVDIAKRLADRRRAAGLTQEALATKLEVSRQAVSKWERSESSPDTDNLIALAKLYNVSLDTLLYEDIASTTPQDTAPQSANSTLEANSESTTNTEAPSQANTVCDGQDDSSQHDDDAPHKTEEYSAQQSSKTDASNDTCPQEDARLDNDNQGPIGADGIHIEDGTDSVHISWRDGIEVCGKQGDHVHIGWDGIRLQEQTNQVHIDRDGIRVNDRTCDSFEDANEAMKSRRRHNRCQRSHTKRKHTMTPFARAWNHFPFSIIVIIAYVILGSLYETWGIGLFLFFIIPAYYMLGVLIDTKRIGSFLAGLYPLVTVAWFCWMAFVLGQPHPAWVVLLSIPLFEWIVVALTRWYHQHKKSQSSSDS